MIVIAIRPDFRATGRGVGRVVVLIARFYFQTRRVQGVGALQDGGQPVRERGDRVRHEGVQLVVQKGVGLRAVETHVHQAQQTFSAAARDLPRDFGRNEKPRETTAFQVGDQPGGDVGSHHSAQLSQKTFARHAAISERGRQRRRCAAEPVGRQRRRSRRGQSQSAGAVADAAEIGRQRLRPREVRLQTEVVVAGKQFRLRHFDQFK